MGWRSEPEVSVPCSEYLIRQTASVITAAQPAAGVFPNWQLQGAHCTSLAQEGPEISCGMTQAGGKGRAPVAFVSRASVDQPSRNQKIKWISGQGKRIFVSDSEDWESHFSF